jgi:hypothetical protein
LDDVDLVNQLSLMFEREMEPLDRWMGETRARCFDQWRHVWWHYVGLMRVVFTRECPPGDPYRGPAERELDIDYRLVGDEHVHCCRLVAKRELRAGCVLDGLWGDWIALAHEDCLAILEAVDSRLVQWTSPADPRPGEQIQLLTGPAAQLRGGCFAHHNITDETGQEGRSFYAVRDDIKAILEGEPLLVLDPERCELCSQGMFRPRSPPAGGATQRGL